MQFKRFSYIWTLVAYYTSFASSAEKFEVTVEVCCDKYTSDRCIGQTDSILSQIQSLWDLSSSQALDLR